MAAELAGRLGRHDEAKELIWADFADHPAVEGYQRLRAAADADGTWPGWRERALGELRRKRPSYEYAASLWSEFGLRTTHKRKRAFVAALDAVPIPD